MVTLDRNSFSKFRMVIFFVSGVPAGSSTIASKSSVAGVVSAASWVIFSSAI